jgi:Cu2+-exporting ATPase
VVTALAQNLGIAKAYGEIDPLGKQAFIKDLIDKGHKVLMIGDGLNDAAALKEATVSISASSGLDIAQNAADFIFKGQSLKPIRDAVVIAKSAMMIVRQNLWIALGYNLIAIPLAISGQMTPMIAAIFMSASSLMVVFNAFRLKGHIKPA